MMLLYLAQEIAECVALTQGVDITPTVELAPDIDLPKVKDLIIFVTPQNFEKEPDTRRSVKCDAVFNIGVAKKVCGQKDLEKMLRLVDDIGNDLMNRRLYSCQAIVSKIGHDPIYDARFIREMNVFVSVIVVSVKVLKQ